MADIHILEGSLKGFLDDAALINFPVVYHIPITEPNPEVAFPDFVSSVPDISPAELDGLKAGTLFEKVETETYNSNVDASEQSQRLKDKWVNIRHKTNQIYPLIYRFFGVTLDAAD